MKNHEVKPGSLWIFKDSNLFTRIYLVISIELDDFMNLKQDCVHLIASGTVTSVPLDIWRGYFNEVKTLKVQHAEDV